MITSTLPVTGTIREIRDGRILIDNGDRRDGYNVKHYHLETQPQLPPDKQQTIDNLLELSQTTKMHKARRIYWNQALTMMRRRLPK